MAKRPAHDGASWGAAELKKLKSLAKKGLSAAETADALQRTAAAVQQKAMREGISFRAARGKAKKASKPVKPAKRAKSTATVAPAEAMGGKGPGMRSRAVKKK